MKNLLQKHFTLTMPSQLLPFSSLLVFILASYSTLNISNSLSFAWAGRSNGSLEAWKDVAANAQITHITKGQINK